jgi:hypothetical protein
MARTKERPMTYDPRDNKRKHLIAQRDNHPLHIEGDPPKTTEAINALIAAGHHVQRLDQKHLVIDPLASHKGVNLWPGTGTFYPNKGPRPKGHGLKDLLEYIAKVADTPPPQHRHKTAEEHNADRPWDLRDLTIETPPTQSRH